MKTLSKYIAATAVAASGFISFSSCSDDFLVRYPENNYTGESYYASDEAVLKAVEPLYNRAWFDFNQRAILCLGSYRANDAWNPYVNPEFTRFQTTALTGEVLSAWSSLYTVVTMSNTVISDISKNVTGDVSDEVRNQAIGEAHLFRGAAYFYMVRIWGPVILFEDNDEVVLSPMRPLNREEDVLEFCIRDFRKAAMLLPEQGINKHASRYAAKALLAKALLARSGWNKGGTRDENDLNECMALCDEIINKSPFGLMAEYEDLFKPQHNDNIESLLAMKWASPLSGTWGSNNPLLSDLSFPDVCDVNCWGTDLSISVDMLDLYNEDPKDKKRLNATFFNEDVHYDYIRSADGGFTYEKKWMQVKKGVVGCKADVDGQLASQASPLNTYIIRLADVYLTYAEAALGNSQTLSGGPGLDAFNEVRIRAGVDTRTSISLEDIIRERRIEFCMEYCNMYDFVTWYRWKPEYMLDYLNHHQHRDIFFTDGCIEKNEDGTFRYNIGRTDDDGNIYWSDALRDKNGKVIMTKEEGYVFDVEKIMTDNGDNRIVITPTNIFMPYPEVDVIQNPYLSKAPEPYNFGK